jgi:polyketide synthase PksN
MSLDGENDLDAEMRQFLDDELMGAVGAQPAQHARPAAAREAAAPGAVALGAAQPSGATSPDASLLRFRQEIAGIASTVLKIPPERLDVRENMARYGVDSIIVTEIMKCISDLLDLPIAPTVFFEARHLEELAGILFQRYRKKIEPRYQGETQARFTAAPSAVQAAAISASDPAERGPAEVDADVEGWISKFRRLAAHGVGDPVLQTPAHGQTGRSSGSYEPVAIIAMDGVFADSANLQEFEQHLRQGDDCIREIPADRWDWRKVFGDPAQGEFSNVKYGGFAPGIDHFDPLFFGMSPREAEVMDPQHRMFIQCVWKLIESAGYAPKSLSGKKIGIFIGINLQDYAHMIDRAGAMEVLHMTSLGHMFCPNRLSFLLDLHGPSQVIDTACSSSLVALHRAVLSIQHEGCEMAIAGGANLLISPDLHIMYSKVGMICEDGRCKTFSDQANGYVRGDGVGAVLLKSLKSAERDGDTILAVIRGSAENHGGMSTSLTAPNPKAQASLIVEAHRRAGIDPRSVGYIECHGTGTVLGDPIEINGLKMAFAQLHQDAGLEMPESAYCGLGSVKSNIGHAETAAGIAGVIKAVLAIRNKRLYQSLHSERINPMIELEQSPFYILQEPRPWQRPVIDGEEQARRAGVSSFGAGGSNAHVLIEEYVEARLPPVQRAAPVLVLLSAKNEARLAEAVANLLDALNQAQDSAAPDIADLAYTLQVGREAMAERLAVVADSLAELKAKLGRIAGGKNSAADGTRGNLKQGRDALRLLNEDAGLLQTVKRLFSNGEAQALAELWVQGVEVDWPQLYAETNFQGRRPRRISLPVYPFAQQRHWISESAVGQGNRHYTSVGAQLHPLAQQNTSDFSERRFSSVLTGKEFFLADHVVMGEKVLPGVAYLEMARAALAQVVAEADRTEVVMRLKNVVWARPFAVQDQPATLHIGLYPEQDEQVAYQIYSKPAGADDEVVLHGQGSALLQQMVMAELFADIPAGKLDLNALRNRIAGPRPEQFRLDARQCYEAYKAMGIAYGGGHQCLESVYFSAPLGGTANAAPEVLAKLVLPASSESGAAQFVLHPGLIDSGLQACIGLLPASGIPLPSGAASADAEAAAALPFALDSLTVLTQPPSTMWVWIRYADGSSPSDRLRKLNIDYCDEEGRICIRMKGFSSRSVEQKPAPEADRMLLCKPVWTAQPVDATVEGADWSTHLIVLCDFGNSLPASIEQRLASRLPGARCERIRVSAAIEDGYPESAIRIFELIRDAFARKFAGRMLLQVLIPGGGTGLLLGGLSGLLKTATRENSRFTGQLIELDGAENAERIAERVAADRRAPEQVQIRYRNAQREVLRWQEQQPGGAESVLPWKDRGVYLITGGAGGLGLLFARQIAVHSGDARLVLCGRSSLSPEQQAQLDRLSASGVTAEYRQLDVGSRQQVDALIADLLRTHGRIDGILHCAGLLRDNFIHKKSAAEFAQVLAPKVAGTVHLDQASEALDMDFFALFSSGAGALGSAGQADYACANAFMDSFADYRNGLVEVGLRRGLTVSIDWPLWAGGGMRMEANAQEMMRQATGMSALPDEWGIEAFRQILASGAAQTMVLHGAPSRIRRMLDGPVRSIGPELETQETSGSPIDAAALRARVQQMLLQFVAKLMKFDLADLDVEAQFSDYGFDSITLTDFSNRLNQQYRLELTPTAFFEYPTIAAFAAWLGSEYQSVFAKAFGLQPRALQKGGVWESPLNAVAEARPRPRFANTVAAAEPPIAVDRIVESSVAIVGISGRFPMAADPAAFWNNLLEGKDCISEIPEDRWDWRALYGDPATEANKTNIKWGGFIDGIANFDARFFGISPREAELMDPQQRLLMEYVWKAIEDAGYSPASLSGSDTAIFIGTASSGYGELMAHNGSAIESYSSTGVVGSVGPNRMSYFLNLHGPSEPIETACSSSLVAIHRALSAIANGDCDQAVVGGINLIISPETQISFNKAGMLCQDGRCKTFSSKANGYVRGEGVGMLFLKKLDAAERAGDHIYGVIRGSAENHGGRGNSLTAPNPKAQAELIKAAYTRAGIDPRTVGYIEAHGTGTELGDPIEINGLKSAFKDLYQGSGTSEVVSAHCGLGSVKTNIGHLELAAGVAGVIKVLLQLRHKTLVKSLHCDEVNPYVQLQDSPFYLVRENRAWTPIADAHGRALPRRAGVSSFGFGGVNAHVVIEEYIDAAVGAEARPDQASLFVLSARNPERLKASAEDLLAFVVGGTATGRQDAAPNPGHAHQVLQQSLRSLVAQILQLEQKEIEPQLPLDDYGFEPVHRAMLPAMLQQAWGIELAAKLFLDNHTIAAMVVAALESSPALQQRLAGEAVPATEQVGQSQAGDAGPGLNLADLAYTLQVGREAMDERLALVATTVDELAAKLHAFIEGRTEGVNDLYVGQARQNRRILSAFSGDDDMQEALEKWMQRGKFSRLLEVWTSGLNVDWEKLYGDATNGRPRPRRISAPGYSFARLRFWVEAGAAKAQDRTFASAALHPLVHQNRSTLQQFGFLARFTGKEFFLADHRVRGQQVLPGVAYLEMARAAAMLAQAEPQRGVRLQDVAWISPFIVNRDREIRIDLDAGADGQIRFEIYSQDDSTQTGRQLHCQGLVARGAFGNVASLPRLDPVALLAQPGMAAFDAAQVYQLFSAAGFEYGPAHRGIVQLHVGNGHVLARLALPEPVADTLPQFVLHPGLMDSGLQASIGLALGSAAAADSGGKSGMALPFAVETVDVLGVCSASMWAWVRRPDGASTSDRVQKLDIDLCDEQGQVCVRLRGFSSRVVATGPSPRHSAAGGRVGDCTEALRAQAIDYFKQLLSSILKYAVSEISADESLSAYGIDSMMVMELTAALEKPFGHLSKTLFFEYQTLGDLVDHFLQAHRPQLLKLFVDDRPEVLLAPSVSEPAHALHRIAAAEPTPYPAAGTVAARPPAPTAGGLDIAVIGMSGRYPQARNIEEFWLNLRDGRDCITEVPKERWDWRDYYSVERGADGSELGRHGCKWGGFIEDIDKFDPLFFNISPGAAEFIDPQERLFLQHAWMAMEDAGYRREDLQHPGGAAPENDEESGQVGVYAGVMYGEYQLLGLEATLRGKPTTIANLYASVANRVSYSLNLHGPSMTVDTMCSSSLTAIHLACQDLKLGRTQMALAGGVNVSIHPNKYSMLSAGQFISGNGKCESFGAGGEGYVPSEGVGVVLLKRLADAERDGDHIYGVIKGSALNHGGKTNGYSVPNPNAQHRVISRALREANIDPRSINYIEAHGTGTRLGDPIEIAGLGKVFGKGQDAAQPCWIGSAKSNIGHTESAAGIAGLTKVLLQMREGQIAPSLHSQTLNSNIDFTNIPFQVNQQLRKWPRPLVDGRARLRVAGISSFGAGGSNAHLVVEEYLGLQPAASHQGQAQTTLPVAIVLSARTEAQVKEAAENLLQFLRLKLADRNSPIALRDVAYTLQVGREAMPQRLAFVADSLAAMIDKLNRYLQGDASGLHLGRARFLSDRDALGMTDNALMAGFAASGRHEELLANWVNGTGFDWRQLYAAQPRLPSRISLPTYPFARERYWPQMPDRPVIQLANGASASVTAVAELAPAAPPDSLMTHPVWSENAIPPSSAQVDYAERRILFAGAVVPIAGAICLPLHSNCSEPDLCFTDCAVQVFEQVKEILGRKQGGRNLMQIVTGGADLMHASACPDQLTTALALLLKTAQMENPQFTGQLIELDASAAPDSTALADLLRQNGHAPGDTHVRYRNGRRMTKSWIELDVAQNPPMPVWKQGGVYLITGGAGGLGLIFAREIVRQVSDVTLILTGRSQPDDACRAEMEALRAVGATVEFRTVDVSDRQAVLDLIGSIERDFQASQAHAGRGGLNGIIHSAGIIRDNFIFKKTDAEFKAVLASKVSGVVNLDLASRSVNLDFFILFSSLAGAVGNPGQADYATANAFLDAYAAYRNRLSANGTGLRPKGRTLSINWPLWQHGGMDLDARSKEIMWRSAGIKPLQTQTGIDALYRGLASCCDQVIVTEGDGPRLRQLFVDRQGEQASGAAPQDGAGSAPAVDAPEADHDGLLAQVQALVAQALSDMLKLPLHRIEADVPMEQYGIDSVAMTRLAAELEKVFGSLPKTLFFEYPSIELVSAYLVDAFPRRLEALFAPAPLPPPLPKADIMAGRPLLDKAQIADGAEADVGRVIAAETTATWGVNDIAVIGMSGRFPLAPDLDAFWENLAQGRDCITGIPPQRWDHRQYFDPDRSKAGKSYCNCGGFLDDVEQFDALFFKVAPGEAEVLDPQERLFLETVWNLLESSGYLGETLQRLCQSRVGVFAGSMSQQYHAFESDLTRESMAAMSSHSSIANRVSYFFNFQGPSIAIDTMCSSALVAIHMACESLAKGECRVAIAGGVNLSIHPKKYIGLSAGQIIGSHPDSTAFGDGDGYIPSEAVGAVLLKPLRQAIVDDDTILAVIKSSAINHGGQSNGYYVPNGSAQADLISGNFDKAGIDPRTVSYVEAAANGSPLGDAIEVNALSAGFRKFTGDEQFCAIGSVKSNIGHAEAASGMSQLIKVLLQLQHRQLAPTIKADPVNPNIRFEHTPFRLQRQLEAWRRPVLALAGGASREYPRRATVSAFGAGGSNAHLILEEYPVERNVPDGAVQGSTQVMLLSARTRQQLAAVAAGLLAFLNRQPALSMADLAYTLQTGRESMDYRLALVVDGRDQLIHGLKSFLQPGARGGNPGKLFAGDVEQDHSEIRQLLSGRSGLAVLQLMIAEKDVEKLAMYWIKGVRIQWQAMHDGTRRKRLALPAYPFERKRYWLGDKAEASARAAPAVAQPFAADAQQSPQENVERYLAQFLVNTLGLPADEISPGKSLQDFGVDSIASSRLRRGLEQAFQVQVSARDLFIHASLAALTKDVAARVSKTQRGLAGAESSVEPGKPLPATQQWPLSEGQKGLWLLHQLSPQTSAYNIPVALRFRGVLDIPLFRQAWQLVLESHPPLRSLVRQHQGELVQVVPAERAPSFEQEVFDPAIHSGAIELLRQKSKQAFDLERGPLARMHVFAPASGKDCHVLIVVHHIVFDGSSAMLMVQALLRAYRSLLAGAEPRREQQPSAYADFVEWQQQFMASEQGRAQCDYWKTQLAGELAAFSLPSDHPKPAAQGFDGASHELKLSSALTERVRTLSKSLQVNFSALFLGVFNILLHRYSTENDILVGMPTLGRPQERFDRVIGYFVNMIVIRCKIGNAQQGTADFLKDLQLVMADGLDNAEYPFPALLRELKTGRDRAGSPLFQVMYAYQNFVRAHEISERRDELRNELPDDGYLPTSVEFVPGINQEGSHDLALEVYQGADHFLLKMDYRTELFRAETIERAMRHYVNLLESIAAHPQAALAEHKMLSPDEWRKIVLEWNAVDDQAFERLAAQRGIAELFERQAQRTPDKTALLFENQSLTYAELDSRSAQLANYLTNHGAGQSGMVGVCLGRGPGMVVALLAILKAGAVYLPLAADYPEQRIRHLLDDSGTTLVITEAVLRDRIFALRDGPSRKCLALDEIADDLLRRDAAAAAQIRPEQPAYVIYTSGSTGLPRGVVISHAAISHHCQVMRDYYQLTTDDKVLQFASMSVDASLEQLLPPLLCGASVVIRPEELWSAHAFRRRVAELCISIVDLPPSYLHELLLDTGNAQEWSALQSLRLVIAGGEALMPETLSLWRSSPLHGCRLVNAYGPTETTITSTAFEVTAQTIDAAIAAGNTPIGKPLAGETAYILDPAGQPVALGIAGELHIGGAGLAIGYLNQPELTQRKFIDNPFAPGARIYKTGDAAHWLADGNIAFLGRLDQQVKIRGFRVECGEVEAALQSLDSVGQAVVLARHVDGNTQLVAFVVPDPAENTTANPAENLAERANWKAGLKLALESKLPEQMIPSVFVSLARIPLMPGGKTDRAALESLDIGAGAVGKQLDPRNETEARLAQIWRQVLNVDRVGIHDSFFDLGGHSLLSVRLMAAIHRELGRELPLSSLFRAPTVAAQATLLQQGHQVWSPLVCLQAEGKMQPWFCIHPVAGNVLCYRELAQQLHEQQPQRPIYALQTPGVDDGGDGAAHPGTIEGLASLYISAMREVQPQGPYHLGGWSMGGVIAYEMALQLQRAGAPVATLALIESYTPDIVRTFEQDFARKNQLTDDREILLLIAFAQELGLAPEVNVHSAAAAGDRDSWLDLLLVQARQSGLPEAGLDAAGLRRLFKVFAANAQALNRYVPGDYGGSVGLFFGDSSADRDGDAMGGWAHLIQGDNRVVTVPGDHASILRKVNVKFLANKLGLHINERMDR